ncbi:BZ3500_MvSof-1268-A1-R1_Chr9g10892 [Microbotryum saponariae]|uniref:BZ3500_MvSof-1268-A1-R1_Chr9g10892 protein n=1 Tax=Microbotryum saponariae TaxID=289078 RepID=A0A2X0MGI5_9BASI|nr:BZ3501_MvSof-1269-A2-R1_Chr9g10640 [Microbotryum saponariae]SDA00872.1 BZ3500_MvSof-1268-A1-R1_Chr9g10892 [Microbotryum saponariae]
MMAQARYYKLQSFKGVLAASLAPIRKGLAHAGEERGNADGGSRAEKRPAVKADATLVPGRRSDLSYFWLLESDFWAFARH